MRPLYNRARNWLITFLESLKRSMQNQNGVAILLAVFSLSLMIFVAIQVTYDTQVEYITAVQGVNRLKAQYAAKAGAELGLMRTYLYKQALAAADGKLGSETQKLLDPIWQFPLSWPMITPEDMNQIDRDKIKTLEKESFMDAQYFLTIEGEGGKIDINALGSLHEEVVKITREQLLQIFNIEKENNRSFRDSFGNYNFDDLIDAIKDWVDEDQETTGRTGGESGVYSDRRESGRLPPNQPFKTLDELHMVRGMDDDLFKLLAPRVTVFGTKGINVNTAPDSVLKSLDKQITDEKVKQILERRSDPQKGGPFKDDKDFFSFLNSIGINTRDLEEQKDFFIFDKELNFRIISVGRYSNVRREIQAVTFDIENLTSRVTEELKADDKAKNTTPGSPPPQQPPGSPPSGPSGGSPPPPPDDKKKFKAPKGRPRVVFWQET